MALLDHKRTWHFVLTASPEQCVNEFAKALQGKNMFSLRKANWSVDRDSSASGLPIAIGTYEGRGGATKALTMMSARAASVEDVASGSQLTFEIKQYDEDAQQSTCAMWLSVAGTALGLTADAGFYRSYMSDVAKRLQHLDPALQMEKV